MPAPVVTALLVLAAILTVVSAGFAVAVAVLAVVIELALAIASGFTDAR